MWVMNVSGDKQTLCLIQGVHNNTYFNFRITGASLDLVRTAKLVLEEYFSLGDTVNDMNKILLKDTKPSRTSFQVGPPEPPTTLSRANSTLQRNPSQKSAFEVLMINMRQLLIIHDYPNFN